jgi:major cell surface glycoprotein (TIGR04216 family)
VVAPDTDPVTAVSYFVRPVGSDRRATLSGGFDRADGTGFIYPNATVYRGERDIAFRGNLTSPLRSVGGKNEGTLLAPPIPTDIAVGEYSVNGQNNTASIQVEKPKITTLRLENTNGADVTDGEIYTGKTDAVTLIAQSNFEDAEQLKLAVRDADGTDITGELIDTATVRAETEFGQPATESVTAIPTPAASANTETDQSIQSTIPIPISSRYAPFTTHGSYYSLQPRTNKITLGLESTGVRTEQAQVSGTAGSDFERTVNQTDIEPGQTVSVSITATVGSNGELSLAEEFTPTVQQARITSTTIGGTGASPDISFARSEGLLFKVSDVSSGTRVEINYQIKTKPISETYRIGGFVKTDGARTDLGIAEIVAGSGGTGSNIVSGGQVRWQLDVSDLDAQTLTTEITGSDDLDTGSAKSTAELTISDASPRLFISDTQPNRGDTITISVLNGMYGSEYTVGINTADIKNDVSPSKYQSIFQNVGTTKEIDVITGGQREGTTGAKRTNTDGFVYAQINIDPDNGVGKTKIQTEYLDDAVTVEVIPHGETPSTLINGTQVIDEKDVVITDPDISLSGPDGYIPDDETTLRGNAESGVDTAVMYVKSPTGSQYELVDLDGSRNGKQAGLSVSGAFREDIILSAGDAPGNRILALPGTYQVAMRSKASLTETRSKVPQTISTATFLGESPSLHTIQVRRPTVTLEEPGMDGKVANTQDVIKINGSVKGRDAASIIAITERGEVETKLVTGPTFTRINLPIDELSTGRLTVYVVSTGRDGQVGDGNFDRRQIAEVETQLNRLQNQLQQAASSGDKTGTQIRALLRTETDLDTASDDPVVSESVRIVPSNVEINRPKPNATIESGSSLQITGSTTVAPHSGSLSILLSRTSGVGVQTRTQIQQWSDAKWDTTFSTANLSPGQYRIKAIIGETTVTRVVEITSQHNATASSVQTAITTEPPDTDRTDTDTAMSAQTSVSTPKNTFTEAREPVSPAGNQSQSESTVSNARTRTRAGTGPMMTERLGDQSLDLPTLGSLLAVITFVIFLVISQRDN